MATDSDLWKKTIKHRLKLRNKKEQHGFTELIDTRTSYLMYLIALFCMLYPAITD